MNKTVDKSPAKTTRVHYNGEPVKQPRHPSEIQISSGLGQTALNNLSTWLETEFPGLRYIEEQQSASDVQSVELPSFVAHYTNGIDMGVRELAVASGEPKTLEVADEARDYFRSVNKGLVVAINPNDHSNRVKVVSEQADLSPSMYGQAMLSPRATEDNLNFDGLIVPEGELTEGGLTLHTRNADCPGYVGSVVVETASGPRKFYFAAHSGFKGTLRGINSNLISGLKSFGPLQAGSLEVVFSPGSMTQELKAEEGRYLSGPVAGEPSTIEEYPEPIMDDGDDMNRHIVARYSPAFDEDGNPVSDREQKIVFNNLHRVIEQVLTGFGDAVDPKNVVVDLRNTLTSPTQRSDRRATIAARNIADERERIEFRRRAGRNMLTLVSK